LDSQYAEIEWVRGVQVRRKLGLEPKDVDPYSGIADADMQPAFESSYAFRWPLGSRKEMHFVHIPKCGGTSITKVLRRVACSLNNGTEDTLDCCKNPGFA
jgi:hypothetical protein